MLIESWLRKGKYPAADYETASKLPPSIAAIVSMVIGLAVAVLGVNQAFLTNYEGPLSHALGDADVGFPLALIVTGVLSTSCASGNSPATAASPICVLLSSRERGAREVRSPSHVLTQGDPAMVGLPSPHTHAQARQ